VDIFCFFFFQAEDGIRDGHVTGVQTCALPISAFQTFHNIQTKRERMTTPTMAPVAGRYCVRSEMPPPRRLRMPRRDRPIRMKMRSEERRGGKEGGRGGWERG